MTKVLYVEDEPFLAKIVKESLESRAFEVALVTDGAKALDEFRSFQPDICILDIMLPNKDGYEIAKEINAFHHNLPIIFLTAKNQLADLKKGFELGGNDYLTKPFSVEELILRINNLLQIFGKNTTDYSQHEIKLGNYTYFPEKMELLFGNNVASLSHRENEIFKLLVYSNNNVVSRKEILDTVWGNDSFFNSRTLDVYIKKLRDYLKNDVRIKIITLKGVGYRFVCA